MMKRIRKVSFFATLLLMGSQALVLAQGSPGLSPFGGELRGATRVKGKILCTSCTLKEAKESNPDLQPQLYEFDNGTRRAIFQLLGVGEVAGIQDASQLAYWTTITGLRKTLPVRIEEALWTKLTAEENLQKEVELTGLLRSTGVLDVGELAFPAVEQ